MLVDKNKVVTISYQLFSLGENEEPLLIEERSVDNPIEFIYGQGVLLPKIEEALQGQSRGFQTVVRLDPRDAYGLHKPDLQVWMDKTLFPKEVEVELGMKFQTQGPEGQVISVIVKQIEEDKVLVDGNHPLAGLKIQFELKLLRVREASEKEMQTKEVDPTQLH